MAATVAAAIAEPYIPPPVPIIDLKCWQTDSYLMQLPTEVLELILEHLDGKSMVRLSSTCAFFYNLISVSAEWGKYAMHETNSSCHLKDLGAHFLTPLWRLSTLPLALHKLHLSHYPWKQIYLSGQVWSSIHKWNFSLSYCSDIVSHDKINSIEVAGQDIVFGTEKGGLGCWNPDKDEKNLNAILVMPNKIDRVIIQLSPDCEDEDMHYQVVTHCIDMSLHIYDMMTGSIASSKSTNRDLKKISNHGDILFEWDPIRGTSACTYIKENSIERCADYKNHQLPYGPFVAVNIFEELCVSQKHGPLLVEFNKLSSSLTLEKLLGNQNNIYVCKSYIWPGQISFSITVSRSTIVSVKKNCNLITWPCTFKCVSASLVGNVLIVGTDCGEILCYPLKNLEDLLHLEPDSYQQKIFIGHSEPITHVGVRMPNHLHPFPDVVAATSTRMFCCRATGFLF